MNSGKYPYKPAVNSGATTSISNAQHDKRAVSFLQKKRKLQYFNDEFVGVVKEFLTLLSFKDEAKKTVKHKKKAVDIPQIKQLPLGNRSKESETQQQPKTMTIIDEPSKHNK